MKRVDDNTARSKFNAVESEPAITEIRFPKYKALSENLKITFTFPITALVGMNGSNKSSILHALYAAPEGRSVADFWFSTSVDSIDGRIPLKEQHRFIYTYRIRVGGKKFEPECRKSRVTRDYRSKVPKDLEKKRDPDYWEPTKISTATDGMRPPPPSSPDVDTLLYDSRERWKLIDKNVIYLDFRSELSAFDKYLYHSPFNRWTPTRTLKKLGIITKSAGLARAFNQKTSRKDEKEKIIKYSELSETDVNFVSEILGKNFTKIEILHHRFYSSAGYSARLHLKGREYSEAHAGSGEFAIIRMVDEISNAEKKSLILLDEPEVSLHPGAQQRLIEFLKIQCLQSGHQIVISTHSPTIVNDLPSDAIKLLGSIDGSSEVELISNDTHPSKAFFHLGHLAGIRGQKIVVEDDLVVELTKRAIRVFHEDYISLITPTAFPGGAEGIIKQSLPAHGLTSATDIKFLLDGDKRSYIANWTKIDELPPYESKYEEWKELATDNLGCEPNTFPNGGGTRGINKASAIENTQKILNWARENLFYLHGLSPEAAILFETDGTVGLGPNIPPGPAKERFVELTRSWQKKTDREVINSKDILSYQTYLISTLDEDSPILKSINVALIKAIQDTNNI